MLLLDLANSANRVSTRMEILDNLVEFVVQDLGLLFDIGEFVLLMTPNGRVKLALLRELKLVSFISHGVSETLLL